MSNTAVLVYLDQDVAAALGLPMYKNSEDSKAFVFLSKTAAQGLRLNWYEHVLSFKEEEEKEYEKCFCANIQVPKKRLAAMEPLNGAHFTITVEGEDVEITLEVVPYQGEGDFDFRLLLWGTDGLSTNNQKEVFEELRRWLRFKRVHKFWHKGLGPTPPSRQDVYMWFQ